MTAHAPNATTGRKSSLFKHTVEKKPSTNTIPSGRPVLQELPKNGPRSSSIFIPDKNSKKTNAIKQMRRASEAAPAVAPAMPCALMQPPQPFPTTRLPSPEASDREERLHKKRKLDAGRAARNEDYRREIQYAKGLVEEKYALAEKNTTQQKEINELRETVEGLKRKNEDLQQQKRALLAEIETSSDDLLKEKNEKTVLAKQCDDTFTQKSKLERQYNISLQDCEKLRKTLDHAVMETRLVENHRTLKDKLQKSQAQMKELESLRIAKKHLTLANGELKARTKELDERNGILQTGMEKEAESSAAQLAKEREGWSTRETKLTGRIDELITTVNILRKDLAIAQEAASREAYEIRLRRAEETADARIRSYREDVEAAMSRLSKLQAECKQKEIDLHMTESNVEIEVRQLKLDRTKREQLELVNELLRDSHSRASRSLLAALNGIEEERSVLSANVLAERALAQKTTQEVTKLREALHSSDSRLVQLDAHKNELYGEYKQRIEEASRALSEKNVEVARLQHAFRQLELRLTAANTALSTYSDELCKRDARVGQQSIMLMEKDLAISHQRKCHIATNWHCAAIKAQRAAAMAECEAQRQEVNRLSVLLQTVSLAHMSAETAKTEAEAELQNLATRHVTTEAELAALMERKELIDCELRTAKITLESHFETITAHKTCEIQLKWMDDKYQETFSANQFLSIEMGELRAQLATKPRAQTVDCGTDPKVQRSLRIDTSMDALPEKHKGVSSRQLNTPLSSVSPAPPTFNPTRLESRTPSRLRTGMSIETESHQLMTPGELSPAKRSGWTHSGNSAASENAQRTAPTQPRNFGMENELSRRRHEENTSRDDDLFPQRKRGPLPPPMCRRSVHKRPQHDIYRPRCDVDKRSYYDTYRP